MYSLKNIILAIAVLAIFGCNNSNNLTMDKAESLMQEHPKDALALLDSLKKHPMASKAENARLALLYSMALDKNYIDVTDDSLICIAENWYSKKTGTREKFLSLYYKGVVNKNAKKYPEAITAFSRAQKLENEIGDSYLLGQLYNQMGYIYMKHYNHIKSLDAFSKAHYLYEISRKENHKNYMLMNIAGSYWNMGDYANSEKYYRKAISEGEKTGYSILVELSATDLFSQYIEQKRYNEAALLNERYKLEITQNQPKFLGNIARLHSIAANKNECEKILKKAWRSSSNAEDSIALYIQEYHIHKSGGETCLALKALENAIQLQNKEVTTKLQQPVLDIQKKLLEKELEYNQYKLAATKMTATLSYILIAILVCITLFFIKLWISKKKREFIAHVELLDDFQQVLQNLQKELQLKDSQLSSTYVDVQHIISTRLNLIHNLSVVLYEKQNSPKAKEIFTREVKNIVKDFSSSEEDMKWMEKVINYSSNNLLQDIYDRYPHLKAEEKKLLCYIYAGFSPKAISIFLNIPVETVYNRKSRLMAKTCLSKAKK